MIRNCPKRVIQGEYRNKPKQEAETAVVDGKKRTTTLVEMYLYVVRLIAAEANICSITDFAQHSFTNRILLVNYWQFLEPEPVASGDGRFVIYVNIAMILGNKTWSWQVRFLRDLCRKNGTPSTSYCLKPVEEIHAGPMKTERFRMCNCLPNEAQVSCTSRQKLDHKPAKVRFVGYSLTQKGYRL